MLGDLNARIAREQMIDKRMLATCPNISAKRQSKDGKLDANGRKVLELFDDIGGIIVNGRTNEDKDGNFTFVGAMGCSVIDYCCCSLSFLSLIHSFSVLDKPYSDHMPLRLLITQNHQVPNQERNLLPKLLWLDRSACTYTSTLNNIVAHTALPSTDVEDRVCYLKQLIVESAPTSNEVKFYEPKQKWFDTQCYNARKKNAHIPQSMAKMQHLFLKGKLLV